MTLGEKIVNLRLNIGLSQEELAEKVNVSRQSVSKWEMNQALPQIDKVLMLCELFNVSTDALLLDKIEVKAQSKSENKGADGKTNPGTNTSLQSRPLMFPSDLDKLSQGTMIVKVFGNNPVKSYSEPYFKATDVYKIGKMDQPYIPGRRFNEAEVFYDIKERNRKVLG